MENTKKYFTQAEALKDVKNTLSGFSSDYSELHNETFNTDYYIIGTNEAVEALEQYGVFDALADIQQYEKDNFGEITTDFADPERVANMLYYIVGEKALQNEELADFLSEVWNETATEETNKTIISIIDDILKED